MKVVYTPILVLIAVIAGAMAKIQQEKLQPDTEKDEVQRIPAPVQMCPDSVGQFQEHEDGAWSCLYNLSHPVGDPDLFCSQILNGIAETCSTPCSCKQRDGEIPIIDGACAQVMVHRCIAKNYYYPK